ncbi:MAG: condensation domain-containing protein [Nocardioides sp.]|uniref:condensation domain-containing protein n=1 Tax=Nocardioides sp. TaxID=35761 RepID=UPI0039E3CD46
MTRREDRMSALSPQKRQLLDHLTAQRERSRPWPVEVVSSDRREGEFPATAGQRRTFLHTRDHPEETFWNMRMGLRLRGPLDAPAMVRAVQRLQDRHDSLRTTFRLDGDRVLQVVAPRPAAAIPIVDLEGLPSDLVTQRMRHADHEEETRPFDLSCDNTLRGRILRVCPDDHALLLTVHHVVLDGWSANVLTRDLFALYDEERGVAEATPEPHLQFHDYAEWQHRWLHSWSRIEQSQYWRRTMAGAPPVLDLTARKREESVGFERGHRTFEIGPAVAEAVREIGRSCGATMFMTLVAAFSVLAARDAAQQEIVIGVPIAARHQSELEDVVGLFANMVPVRVNLRGAASFHELITGVRQTAQDGFCHQDLPIEELLSELDVETPVGYAPVIQVIFALYNYPRAFVELTGIDDEPLSDGPPSEALQIYAPHDVRPDLCIRVYDQLGRTSCRCFLEYNGRALSANRADQIVEDYLELLGRLTADPNAPLTRAFESASRR